jgi:hypothetical protein
MCDIIFSLGLFFFSFPEQSKLTECYLSLHASSVGGNLSHRLCSGLLPIYGRKEFQLRFLNFELRFCLFVFSRLLEQRIPTIGSTFSTTAQLAIASAFRFICKELPDPPAPQVL